MEHTIKCKQCGETGFKWQRGQFGKFFLVAGESGERHQCTVGFTAKRNGVCPVCNGSIIADITRVTWARRGNEKGVLYHIGCNQSVPKPVSEPTSEPITIPSVSVPASKPDFTVPAKDESIMNAAPNDLAAILASAIQPYITAQKTGMDSAIQSQIDTRIQAAIAYATQELKKAIEPVTHTIIIKDAVQVAKVEDKQHKLFPLLLQLANLRTDTYLWGEAGSGKSSAGHVASRYLVRADGSTGIPFFYLALQAQTVESKLMGYMDANGRYVETDFYRAYTSGGMFLLDELELGNGNLLGSLNGALANGHASFPCGIKQRHADFVCIATGNTPALGGTPAYSDRRALDGSVRDRFAFVEWNTDESFEMYLAKREYVHADKWVTWVQAIRREAVKVSPRLIVTQRASVTGARLLAQGIPPATVADMLVWRGFAADSVASLKRIHPIPVIAGGAE